MPTVPANAPSSTTTSSRPDGANYEPDDEWKLQLRKRMEEGLKSMIADARESTAAEARKAPNNLETRLRLEASYKEAVKIITNLAKEQYGAELDRERNQRRWKAGVPISPGWTQIFHEEQQNIMNSIITDNVILDSTKQSNTQTHNSTQNLISRHVDEPPALAPQSVLRNSISTPRVPGYAPSYATTFKPGEAGCEPDDEWKLQLRKRMEEGLQSMVADAKVSHAAEMKTASNHPEIRLRLEASYKQTIQSITSLVKEQYQLELDRERNQRRWRAGVPMGPGWAKIFYEEQQNIVNSIKQSKHRTASGSPTKEIGPVLSKPRNEPPPALLAVPPNPSTQRANQRVATATVKVPKELVRSPPPRAPLSSIKRPSQPSPASPRWDSSIRRLIPSVSCHLPHSLPKPPPEIWKPSISPAEDALPAKEDNHEKADEMTQHGRSSISMDKPGEREKQPHFSRNNQPSHVDPCLRSDDPLGSGLRSRSPSITQHETSPPQNGLIPEDAEEAVKRKEDEARQKATELSGNDDETGEKVTQLAEAEKAKKVQLESKGPGGDALKEQEDFKNTEVAGNEDMEISRREDIHEGALMSQEAGIIPRERETEDVRQGNNTLMTGGTYNFAGGDIHINKPDKFITDKGIIKLFLNIVPAAFHDSGERLDPPRCHPSTRATVIQDILDWLDDSESPELVMWLHGAAGSGKSVIAQTIAQVLCEHGRLSGSFFFTRGSTTGRGDEKKLVPTLAYQLAKYLPETRAHIATAVLCDPAIFDLSLLSQVKSLLINPLRIVSNVMSSSGDSPQLFIIDGLDECLDADVQCRVLQVFAAAMKGMQHCLPHRLLISSRPETHLLTGFDVLDNNNATVCRRLPLDSSHCLDNNIT